MLANNGKNADNQPLQPYSVWYQAIRQMKGLNTRPNFQFTSSMLNSLTILNKNDIPFDVMLPLIDETAKKVHDMKPKDAQTGPAVRYDENVISRQMQLLDGTPLNKDIYQLMSKSIHATAINKEDL